MHRRDALKATGAVAAMAVAGCLDSVDPADPDDYHWMPHETRPNPQESPALKVASFDYYEGENGQLAVDATVSNEAADSQTATFYVSVTVNGDAQRETVDVSLDPGASEDHTFTFDATVEEFQKNGQLDFGFE